MVGWLLLINALFALTIKFQSPRWIIKPKLEKINTINHHLRSRLSRSTPLNIYEITPKTADLNECLNKVANIPPFLRKTFSWEEIQSLWAIKNFLCSSKVLKECSITDENISIYFISYIICHEYICRISMTSRSETKASFMVWLHLWKFYSVSRSHVNTVCQYVLPRKILVDRYDVFSPFHIIVVLTFKTEIHKHITIPIFHYTFESWYLHKWYWNIFSIFLLHNTGKSLFFEIFWYIFVGDLI